MKNIQIPNALFLALVRYHLLDMEDYGDEIRKGLEKKLDAMVLRELYSKSKEAPTPEERENARQEYLDRRGVPDSFRWGASFDER
ncbi:MAG: complexin-2 [Lachnospiraceae bacterium]|nr:complexin-2 [Lachnospiraceae bacterium]